MARYRKRPIEVKADQFWPGKNVEGVLYRKTYTVEDLDGERIIREGPYVVTTQRQEVSIAPGEWVIQESDGVHAYPCAAGEFQRIYEPAPPGAGGA